jgi:NitT/TauT family transport system ATP-binding protein
MSDASATAAIALREVSRRFGAVHAVDRVSLAFARGSFTALVGPSGCGKTTILRLASGLDAPDEGACARGGGERRTGFLFQEPRLLAWRTVRENVALPLELAGVARAERLARADAALALVRLTDAAERFPHQLSGGMKMRASLARALVTRPTELFLDEPFGALDEVTRHELDMELRALWERERFTAVLVTHSLPEAAFLAQRMVVFSPRPARVVADIDAPAGTRDARFWTCDALAAAVRAGSDAMLRAIEETRR